MDEDVVGRGFVRGATCVMARLLLFGRVRCQARAAAVNAPLQKTVPPPVP